MAMLLIKFCVMKCWVFARRTSAGVTPRQSHCCATMICCSQQLECALPTTVVTGHVRGAAQGVLLMVLYPREVTRVL